MVTILNKNLKFLMKHLIKYNLFDYYYVYSQKFIKFFHIKETMDRCTYWMGWRIYRLIVKKLWKWEYHGSANFPSTGACILIANHHHAIDPYFAGLGIYREVNFLAKISLFKIPIVRSLITAFKAIPLRRGVSDQIAIRVLKEKLANGEVIGMFPEGSRTKDGTLQKFHTGTARLCLEMNVPYCPVVIFGSQDLHIGKKVTAFVGKPRYPPADMSCTKENCKAFTEIMYNDMKKLLDEKQLIVEKQNRINSYRKNKDIFQRNL
ncbi:hypothetical protein WKT22_00632 [Candidatus Lokiarchaeum ossiferum]